MYTGSIPVLASNLFRDLRVFRAHIIVKCGPQLPEAAVERTALLRPHSVTLPPLALAIIAYAVFLRNCGGVIFALPRMSPKQPFHSAGLPETETVNSSRRNSTTQTWASLMFLFQYFLAKQLIAVATR